ncbi:zinc finger protein 16-like [Acipenser ruthenus]|uniref:zinc finger protein 16-like n=1 Tax=Acipenser ruthenus TaxID=7906 RepID=UPI0027419E9F|nr:zinc finger protein 16-like [Acipenser ruthenus]
MLGRHIKEEDTEVDAVHIKEEDTELDAVHIKEEDTELDAVHIKEEDIELDAVHIKEEATELDAVSIKEEASRIAEDVSDLGRIHVIEDSPTLEWGHIKEERASPSDTHNAADLGLSVEKPHIPGPEQVHMQGGGFESAHTRENHSNPNQGFKRHMTSTGSRSVDQAHDEEPPPSCRISSTGAQYLQRHGKKEEHQCTECGKSFSQTESPKPHRADTGDPPYHCPECGDSFIQLGNLRSHQRIHTVEVQLRCPACRKTVRDSGHLGIQQQQQPAPRETPYSCPECGESFSAAGALKLHRRIHTGEKLCLCSLCGKSFSRLQHLRNHQRIHMGETPYHCPACGKSFNQSGALRRHQRIHTGETPYHCMECGRSFIHGGALNMHQRQAHAGKTPYHCPECGEGFSYSYQLNGHACTVGHG